MLIEGSIVLRKRRCLKSWYWSGEMADDACLMHGDGIPWEEKVGSDYDNSTAHHQRDRMTLTEHALAIRAHLAVGGAR